MTLSRFVQGLWSSIWHIPGQSHPGPNISRPGHPGSSTELPRLSSSKSCGSATPHWCGTSPLNASWEWKHGRPQQLQTMYCYDSWSFMYVMLYMLCKLCTTWSGWLYHIISIHIISFHSTTPFPHTAKAPQVQSRVELRFDAKHSVSGRARRSEGVIRRGSLPPQL